MHIDTLLAMLRKHTQRYQVPLTDQIMQEFGNDPFLILIACLLSLRAKDIVTIHVCRDLFSVVKTPQALLDLELHFLEKIVYRSGYYKVKAAVLRHVSQELITRFNGMVPAEYEQLISIKGIGPKTANLVLGLAFKKPSICVDTHVHRISNRLGLLTTNSVIKTEEELKKILPQASWIEYNTLLVVWGQNVCVPVSPKCSECPLRLLGCKRIGVKKSR